jgi:hypothetical protein
VATAMTSSSIDASILEDLQTIEESLGKTCGQVEELLRHYELRREQKDRPSIQEQWLVRGSSRTRSWRRSSSSSI